MRARPMRLILAALLVVLAPAPPCPAADQGISATLVKDLERTTGVYVGLRKSLPEVIGAMRSLESYVAAMIEADRLADDGIEMEEYAVKLSGELATVTEMLPSVNGPLKTTHSVLRELKQYALVPIKKVLDSAVVSARLKQNLPRITRLTKSLEGLQPSVRYGGTAVAALTSLCRDYCAKIERSVDAACRAEFSTTAGHARDTLASISPQADGLQQTLGKVETVVEQDLLAALKPFGAIEKPLGEMHGAIKGIHKGMKDFERALDHEIHVGTAKFTVHQILHDWERIVHKLEHDLHVSEAKKWLQKEMDKILAPIMDSVMAPVKRLEGKTRVAAQDFAQEAKAAFDRFEAPLAAELKFPAVDKDLNASAGQIKVLGGRCPVGT